jgi:TorA maturation chaperone TorD
MKESYVDTGQVQVMDTGHLLEALEAESPDAESPVERIRELLECFSLFYLRPRPESWAHLKQQSTWLRFTRSIQQLLEGQSPFGQIPSRQFSLEQFSAGHPLKLQREHQPKRQLPAETSLSRWLLQETGLSLAESEFSHAPCFEAQLDFARRHFVGGLPVSVLPIESLYRRWTWQESAALPFTRQTGLYGGDAAAHMASLLKRFELTVTGDTSLPPDHLAIELNFLGLLIQYGNGADAHQFIDDHLSWLPSYLDTLLDRIPDARVFVSITILLNACLEILRFELLAEHRQAQIRIL